MILLPKSFQKIERSSLGQVPSALLAQEIWSFVSIQNDVVRSQLIAFCENRDDLRPYASDFRDIDLPGDREWPIEKQRPPA